jgi:hypothetical protein
MNDQELKSYWIECLQMALYYNPQDTEEQIRIATILYESDKELKNKAVLQKALDKIKN